MAVSWINSFNSLSHHTVPIVKDKILSYLDNQQKRIMALVLVALGCFAACYVLYRCCCFKVAEANGVEALHKPEDKLEVKPVPIEEDFYALVVEAEKLLKQGKLKDAACIYKEALKIEPKNVGALVGFAKTRYKQNKLDRAAGIYKDALKIEPKNAKAVKGYDKVRKKQDKLKKESEGKKHNPKKPDVKKPPFKLPEKPTVFKKVTLEVPVEPPIKPDVEKEAPIELPGTKEILHDAETLLGQGKFEEAAAKYEAAFAIEKPNSAPTLTNYAWSLGMLKRYEEAAKEFQEVLGINPKNLFALNGHAETLRMQNKLDEAAKEFQEVLVIDPNNAYALDGYAEILRRQGNLVDATRMFQDSLGIKPRNAFALTGLAETQRKQNIFEEAMSNFQESAIEPKEASDLARYNDFAVIHCEAMIRLKKEIDDLAIKFDNYLTIHKTAHTLNLYAQILRMQNKPEEANKASQEALEIELVNIDALPRISNTVVILKYEKLINNTVELFVLNPEDGNVIRHTKSLEENPDLAPDGGSNYYPLKNVKNINDEDDEKGYKEVKPANKTLDGQVSKIQEDSITEEFDRRASENDNLRAGMVRIDGQMRLNSEDRMIQNASNAILIYTPITANSCKISLQFDDLQPDGSFIRYEKLCQENAPANPNDNRERREQPLTEQESPGYLKQYYGALSLKTIVI